MKKVFLVLLLSVLFAVWTVPAVFAADDVKIAEKAGLGKFLTDAKGMTLYIFKKDSPNKSSCTGGCLENWPAFHFEKAKIGAGLNEKDFGVITREDGKKQCTYKGMPLYYFVKDKKAGDTSGQGVNNVWFVAAP